MQQKGAAPIPKTTYQFSLFCLMLVTISVIGWQYRENNRLDPARNWTRERCNATFILLKKILEANHPSLYWYTSKDSLDIYFNEALAGMNDSLTELQYKNKVSWFISKINCGHTS